VSAQPFPPTPRPTDRVLWRADAEDGKRAAADRPGELLRLLSRAWRNVGLYGPDHRVAQTTVTDLHQFLSEVLSRRSMLRLYIQEDTFFEEDKALLEESLRLFSLLTALTERQIRAIQFVSGVEPRELTHLIEVLNQKPAELERVGGPEAYLTARAVQHVAVGTVVIGGTVVEGGSETKTGPATGGGGGKGEGGPQRGVPKAAVKVDPKDAYGAGLRIMDELSYEASMNVPLNLAKARMVVNYFLDIITDDSAALLGMAALKKYDEDTYHHSVNVCILSLLMASQLNMDRPQLLLVGLAALLHDIGKVRVPRDIIAKPSKLTPEEMDIVKRHTIYGAHILRELPGPARLAMVVAFEHHAKYDLSGYPKITLKTMPHLLSRIIWVADCFDAMTTSRRAYRSAKRIDQALQEILDEAGTTFDPLLAKLFCKYCGTYLARSTSPASQDKPGEGTPAPEPPASAVPPAASPAAPPAVPPAA